MERSFVLGGGALSLALICGVGAVACGDDDDATATPSTDGGAKADSGSNTADTGTTVDGGATALSLYERLGGKAGIEAFVQSVVETKVLTDSDLKTYFFNQVATPIPAGHPSAKQIVVCFGRFVGSALGADTYPGAAVEDTANTNTPMHTCRNMVAAHKSADTQLNIGTGTFDKFVGAIAESLMPLVKPTATKVGEITQAEFDALAAALTGTKSDVTTEGAPTGPAPFVAP